MIELLPAAGHVAAFKLSGTLVEDDLDKVITEVEGRLKQYEKVGIVADMTGFHDIGLRASLKDLRFSFGKVFEWHRFPREAVITDKQWIKTMCSMLDPVIPFVSVKTFSPEEAEAAFAWAGDFDPGKRVEAA
ncbi:MAG TPA: STAS/SEC14 domain-containing protein [Sphingobium sp.]|uniref:STAS/SEC14 domain-containing protein n=1 Tax=Sphingobium sp. TaxID=1912891 RepID=UPI002ED199A4